MITILILFFIKTDPDFYDENKYTKGDLAVIYFFRSLNLSMTLVQKNYYTINFNHLSCTQIE